MNDYTTVVGLDVHKANIVVAVLPADASRPIEFVYEAGPCGYQTHRQIEELSQEPV